MKKPSRGPSQRIDGEITGDDDGDGIKNGAIHIARGGENDLVEFIFLAMAEAELAVNVFNHDDGAVNDDAEVYGADGEEVGGFTGGVEKDEGKQKSERNGERGNNGSTDANQKEDQDDENECHAPKKIPFDRVGGDFDEIAAVIVGTHFDVGREKIAVNFDGFFLNAFENILRLFASAHENDAFDGVGVVFPFFPFVLEPKNAETRSVADDDAADILHAYGGAVAAADNNFADVVGGFD